MPRKKYPRLLRGAQPLPADNPRTAPAVRSIPLFSEVMERCRDDIPQFARDVLDVELHAGQVRWLTTRPHAQERFLAAGNRWGKGQINCQPILTPQGWLPVGEAKPGGWVYTQDGTPCRIVGVFPQGKRQCYRMEFDDHSDITVDDTHLWFVRTGTGRFRKGRAGYGEQEVLETKEILRRWGANPRATQRVSIPVVQPVQFPCRPVPIEAYALGLLLGNGCMVGTNVKYSTRDPETADDLRAAGARVSHSQRYDYSVSGLNKPLRELGLMGHSAWEKFIPHDYLWNDVETRSAILQGLMDTDGNIEADSGKMEYSTTSEQLAKDVLFLVQSLGGKGVISSRQTTYTYKDEKRLGRISYRIRFRVPGFCPFRIQRKAVRWKSKSFTEERILRRIEDAGQQETTCIAVDHPSRLYVTKDFIVTHNSFCAAVKLLHSAFFQIRPPQFAHMVDDYLAINLSITIDQALIVWNKCMQLASASPIMRQFIIHDETKTHPFPDLALGRGKGDRKIRSHIWARSSSKGAIFILGHKFDFVNWDEAARDPDGQHTLDDVIRMRLVDREGRLDCTSTGDGRNWYYVMFERALQAFKDGNDEHLYYAQTGSSFENPHVSEARLRSNMQQMSGAMIEQNIFGGFSGNVSLFPRDKLKECYRDMEWPIATGPTQAKYNESCKYGAGIDFGNTQDATVILVYEVPADGGPTQLQIPTLHPDGRVSDAVQTVYGPRIVYAQELKRTDWGVIYDTIARVSRAYNHPPMLFDATGQAGKLHGEALRDERGLYNVIGYDFAGTRAKKEHLITVGQQYIEQAIIKWPYVEALMPLYDELSIYDANDKHLNTDWVMAFVLMCECHRKQYVAQQPITVLSLPMTPLRVRRSYGYGSTGFLERTLHDPESPERAPAFMEAASG